MKNNEGLVSPPQGGHFQPGTPNRWGAILLGSEFFVRPRRWRRVCSKDSDGTRHVAVPPPTAFSFVVSHMELMEIDQTRTTHLFVVIKMAFVAFTPVPSLGGPMTYFGNAAAAFSGLQGHNPFTHAGSAATYTIAPVPEPSTLALGLGGSIAVVAGAIRRRRTRCTSP